MIKLPNTSLFSSTAKYLAEVHARETRFFYFDEARKFI